MQWFRFYDEAIDDDKLAWIAGERARNVPGNVPRNIRETLGVLATLLSLANRSPERGVLLIAEGIPHNVSSIGQKLDLSDDDTKSWLDLFTRVGTLSLSNETYRVTNWGRRQFASDNVTTRTRKAKGNVPGNVPAAVPGNAPEADTETEADTEGKGGADAPAPPDDDHPLLNHPLVLEYRDLWRQGGVIPPKDKPSIVKAMTEIQDTPEYSLEEALVILRKLREHERRLDDKGLPYIITVIVDHLTKGTIPAPKSKGGGASRPNIAL